MCSTKNLKKKGKECEDRFNWYFKKAPLTCVVVYVTIHILFSEKVKTPSAPHLSVVEFLHLPEIYLIYSQSITKLEGLMVYSQNPKNPDLSLEEDWWSQSHQNRIVGKIPFLGHAWFLKESLKKPWKKINMEAENPLIEKENHLNQTSIFWWGPAVDFSGIVLAENVRPKNPAMALESRKSLMEPERCGAWVSGSGGALVNGGISGLGGLLTLNIWCFLDQDPNKRYIYIIIYLYII